MSWADGRLCGFDIETTGEGREIARIMIVTVVQVGAGQPTETPACSLIRGWRSPPGQQPCTVSLPSGLKDSSRRHDAAHDATQDALAAARLA